MLLRHLPQLRQTIPPLNTQQSALHVPVRRGPPKTMKPLKSPKMFALPPCYKLFPLRLHRPARIPTPLTRPKAQTLLAANPTSDTRATTQLLRLPLRPLMLGHSCQ